MSDVIKSEEYLEDYEVIFYKGINVYLPRSIEGIENSKDLYNSKKRLIKLLDHVEVLFREKRITLSFSDVVNNVIFRKKIESKNKNLDFTEAGYYDLSNKSISINADLIKENDYNFLLFTLLHEIGHAIQDNYLRKVLFNKDLKSTSYLESSSYNYFFAISNFLIEVKNMIKLTKDSTTDIEDFYDKYKDNTHFSLIGLEGIEYILGYLILISCIIHSVVFLNENKTLMIKNKQDLYDALEAYDLIEKYKIDIKTFNKLIKKVSKFNPNVLDNIINKTNKNFKKDKFLLLYNNFAENVKEKKEISIEDFLVNFSFKNIEKYNSVSFIDVIVDELNFVTLKDQAKVFLNLSAEIEKKVEKSVSISESNIDYILDNFLYNKDKNQEVYIPKNLSALIKKKYEENKNLYSTKIEALEKTFISIFPSEYSTKSEFEHFAELFAYFIIEPEKLMKWQINLIKNVMTISRAINNKEIMKAHKNSVGSLLNEYIKEFTRLI